MVPQVVEEPLPEGDKAGTTAAKGAAMEEGAAKGGSEPATLAVEGLVVQSVAPQDATDGVEKDQNQQVVVVKEVIPLHLEIAIPSNPLPEEIYRSALKGPQLQQETEPAPEPALKLQPQLQPQPRPLAILPAEPAVSGGAVVGAIGEDAATEPMPEIVAPKMDPLGPMGKILRPAGWAVAIGAGVLSLVGVVVGVGKLKGWLEKRKRLAKGKKEGEQKVRRRRHVRDWRVSGE